MMLEDESLGGDVALVGDDTDLQGELLLRTESRRGGDQVGGEPAGEEIAGRTADEQEQGGEGENQFIAHA
jgi:hypothetical protein